jgi:type VI secretion system protein ImpK
MPKPMDTAPSASLLMDFQASPPFEQLLEQLLYEKQPDTFPISINPIVTAASGLLSECVQLRRPEVNEENLAELSARLSNAITQFQQRAEQAGVANYQIMAARYLLCALLDETITSTSWGTNSDWAQVSLLSAFHNETFGGEKFFLLLTELVRNPTKHRAMLELIYLCLALGFEGQCRPLPNGTQEVSVLRVELFRQLRPLHEHVSGEVSPHWQGVKAAHRRPARRHRIVPWQVVAVCVLIGLGGMYASFAWVLGEQRDALLQLHQYFTATSPSVLTRSAHL